MNEESPLVSLADRERGASVVDNQHMSVEFRIQVGISKVLDAEERFTADYELYLRFDAPPELKEQDDEEWFGARNFKLESLPSDNIPEPTFHGTESVDLIEQQCKLDKSQGKIYMFYNWLVTFRETFCLHRFPFDSQLFSMKIELGYMELQGGDDVAVYYGGDSWYLKAFTVKLDQDGSIDLNVLTERKPGFYMWNILLLNFFLVMVNSAVVGIHREELADRLGVTLTLMLSAIAFKFVLMQTIPVVSYLTLLDKYVIMSFSWLFVSCAESYLAATLLSDEMDNWLNGVAAGLWLTLHVAIVVGTLCGWFRVTNIEELNNARSGLMQELALSTKSTSKPGLATPGRVRTYSALGLDRYKPDSQGPKI